MRAALQDYTEIEFKTLIDSVYNRTASDQDVEDLVYFFDVVVEHPHHEDLLNYPTRCGIEDSPEAIIAELKRWYASQGLPCFKQD